MKKTICICDVCNKEMVIKKQYTRAYQFKSYLLHNSECKSKMDICGDCFDKFKTFVTEELKEQNSIIDSLKPKCSNEMPKDIVCNCTKEQK